ncbi:MAG TPA: hypothetical protein VHL30_02325 [Chlamydiales bacterium]|jgi:hypothetical protein|nr:hypothetical protein [Chlamydiales bacterium]
MNSITTPSQEYYTVTRVLYRAAWEAEDSTSCSSILAKIAFIAFPIIAAIALLETVIIPVIALANHCWSSRTEGVVEATQKAPVGKLNPKEDAEKTTRERLLEKLTAKIDGQYKELVLLFEHLESVDPIVAEEATATLNFLKTNGYTLTQLVDHSLPLWPCDYAALQKIAQDSATSKNPIVRQRGSIARDLLEF